MTVPYYPRYYQPPEGFQALGSGLRDLGRVLALAREREDARRVAEQRRGDQLALMRARDLSQPGASTLPEAIESGHDLRGLNRIADAGEERVPLEFLPPPPLFREGGGQMPVVGGPSIPLPEPVRDRTPYVTASGVVMDPRRARLEGEAQDESAYRRTQGRAQAQVDTERERRLALLRGVPGIPEGMAPAVEEFGPGIVPGPPTPRNIDPRSEEGLLAYERQRKIDAANPIPSAGGAGSGSRGTLTVNQALEQLKGASDYATTDYSGRFTGWKIPFPEVLRVAEEMAAGGGLPAVPATRSPMQDIIDMLSTIQPPREPGWSVRGDNPVEAPMQVPVQADTAGLPPVQADTAGFGEAQRRAQELLREGKSRAEIREIMRAEGYDIQ